MLFYTVFIFCGFLYILFMKITTGFTLIELLIVLAIVGILAAIIFPSYNYYLVKIRRSNAESVLYDISARLEEFYAANNTYSGATLSDLDANLDAAKDYYDFDISANATTYMISAVPIGTQAKDDDLCQTLQLNQNGEKSVTGSGEINDCW